MIKVSFVFVVGFAVLFQSCKPNTSEKENITDSKALLESRYQKILEYPVDSVAFPRSLEASGEIRKASSGDWTSGFFPGNLWQLYKLTGNDAFREKAKKWTAFMEREQFNTGTHDVGFMLYCSVGSALKYDSDTLSDAHYKEVIIQSAKTLIKRFNEKVGATRSWDFNKDIWEYPVIVDNMMNLELLFEATELTGDSIYRQKAITHANTTLKNHFRPDNSSYHVVVYDTITGAVKNRITHQGYADESAWARGQAWAIYGYTLTYRYTKDPVYLEQAEKTAAFVLQHPNLPVDGIPYWDLNDPSIPNAPRDASAATIMASAFVELYQITGNKVYKDYIERVLRSLETENYLVPATENAPFILMHSTGNKPKDSEIDVPIVYADYYLLETLIRLQNL